MERFSATLIQDVGDFLAVVAEALPPLRHQYQLQYEPLAYFHQWLIREQIERVYNFECVGHQSRLGRYGELTGQLDNLLNLDQLTGAYIKVPRLYEDSARVLVSLLGFDLYIEFFRAHR